MYQHSYGNRIKKNIRNEHSGEITYSPYLFEPYFAQYESWRDWALDRAREQLDQKQDAVILTLDFKRFFYGVDMSEDIFASFITRFDINDPWIVWVNDFVYQVLRSYSEFLRPFCDGTEFTIEDWTILPIGFLPSNILSNWVLTAFDNAVIHQWNPVKLQ